MRILDLQAGNAPLAATRPPLGLVVAAAYLALWALILTADAVFTAAAMFVTPRDLTFENVVVAFSGIPVFEALAVLMLTAAYGIATNRIWARRLGHIASLAGFAVLSVAILSGARANQSLMALLNFPPLIWMHWYFERPASRAYFGKRGSGS